MSTGSSSRRGSAASLALFLILLLAPGSGRAQTYKLSSLRLAPDVAAGSWVSYQVDVVAPNRPARRMTQRIAVVSREGAGPESGVWVELKTTEGGRARTERGFFMKPEGGRGDVMQMLLSDEDPAPAGDEKAPASTAKLRLARYQRLMPDGKLLEYAVDDEGSAPSEEDVSAMDMFEFAGRGTTDTLAPDTLRVGRRVVPCRVRWVRRFGSQEWPSGDSTHVNRAVMTQTYWRNPWVPVTGTAKKTVEVSSARVSARGAVADSILPAPPDSTPPAPTSAPPGTSEFFYRATITLLDLGKDAVPEITQAPEPAPREAAPRPRAIIK